MKKIVRNLLGSMLLVIITINAISLYSIGGEFRIHTLLSPFHFREKVLDATQFSLQAANMGIFRVQHWLDEHSQS